jgi:hypothetical protein
MDGHGDHADPVKEVLAERTFVSEKELIRRVPGLPGVAGVACRVGVAVAGVRAAGKDAGSHTVTGPRRWSHSY